MYGQPAAPEPGKEALFHVAIGGNQTNVKKMTLIVM